VVANVSACWGELGLNRFLIDDVPAGLLTSVKTLLSLAKQIKSTLIILFVRRAIDVSVAGRKRLI